MKTYKRQYTIKSLKFNVYCVGFQSLAKLIKVEELKTRIDYGEKIYTDKGKMRVYSSPNIGESLKIIFCKILLSKVWRNIYIISGPI